MSPQECKEKVAEIARKLHARKMVTTNEGNVSYYDGTQVYITPSQVCKEDLSADMIAVCDLQGKQLGGPLPISSETKLHLHIYQLRQDVHAVVHNHSPYATAFAIKNIPIESKSYTEMIYFHDKIPVVAYGTPGTPDIYAHVKDYIYQTDIFLLANHGLVAAGADLNAAFQKAETAEALAKTLAIVHMMGGAAPLPDKELARLHEMRKNNLGKARIK